MWVSLIQSVKSFNRTKTDLSWIRRIQTHTYIHTHMSCCFWFSGEFWIIELGRSQLNGKGAVSSPKYFIVVFVGAQPSLCGSSTFSFCEIHPCEKQYKNIFTFFYLHQEKAKSECSGSLIFQRNFGIIPCVLCPSSHLLCFGNPFL